MWRCVTTRQEDLCRPIRRASSELHVRRRIIKERDMNKSNIEYRVVSMYIRDGQGVEDFSDEVNRLLAEGYQLQGGVSISATDFAGYGRYTELYAQAMYRDRYCTEGEMEEEAHLVKFEYDAMTRGSVFRGYGPNTGKLHTPTTKYLLVYALSFGAAQKRVKDVFYNARNFENLTVFSR